MKSHLFLRVILSLLVAGLVLAAAALLPAGVLRSLAGADAANPSASASTSVDLTGAYVGRAKLDWGLVGVYSDTLATPTPQPTSTPPPRALGSIDLALQLTQSGTIVSGYIMLDRTMVFTKEHTIMATPFVPTPGPGTPTPVAQPLDTGPHVTGTFDGTTLTLESEPFALVVGGKTVTRQFRLVTSAVQSDGARLTGEYRETMTGYGIKPATVVGTFELDRPLAATPVPTGPPPPTNTPGPSPTPTRPPGANKIYLPHLAQGAD